MRMKNEIQTVNFLEKLWDATFGRPEFQPPVTWNEDREFIPTLEYLGLWADKCLEMEAFSNSVSEERSFLGYSYNFPIKGELFWKAKEAGFRVGLFNDGLICEMKKCENKTNSNGVAMAEYLKFYNDCIFSVIRNHENIPDTISQPPFFDINWNIFELGEYLWLFFGGSESCSSRVCRIDSADEKIRKPRREIKFYLAKYCYFLGLWHAFVCNDSTNSGYFPYFEYDGNQFGRVSRVIETIISKSNSKRDLSQAIPEIKSLILEKFKRSKGYGYVFNESFEPLTWHLVEILNAVNVFGFSDAQAVKDFALKSLDLYQDSYKKKEVFYSKIFDMESLLLFNSGFLKLKK